MRIKEIWDFIWDNTILSWTATLLLSFLIANFVFYPAAEFALQTEHPVVVVISGSMKHNGMNYYEWWLSKEQEYKNYSIDESAFYDFPYRNGLNEGDLMLLRGKPASEISVGEIIVFSSGSRPSEPTIHRVVGKSKEGEKYIFSAKGDNNIQQLTFEKHIEEQEIFGTAFFRIPLAGHFKLILKKLFPTQNDSFLTETTLDGADR